MPESRAPYSARAVVRVAAGAVVLLSLVIGLLLAVTVAQFVSARDRVQDDLNPARVELGTVLALYVDQETAERGYILTGRPEFLEPYDEAAPQITTKLDHLRREVSDTVADLLVEMDDAHQRWLDEAAEPELAAERRGDRSRAEELVASGDGKRLFDRVRTAYQAADQALAAEQDAANQRADVLLRRLSYLLGFTVVTFLATVLLGTGAFNRRVLRPLAELGRSSRAVASGDLQHVVRGAGPREVSEVGEDVDTMRRHLLDELDASRRASEALVLGQPAVQALQSALSELAPVGAGVEVAAQIESAEGVLAGDFIDIVDLGDDRVAMVLGDVSGHGHESAVVGLRLKSALSAMLRQAPVPDVLAAVRDGLVDSELFATVFVAVLDTAADRLSFVNAGHPPPLLVAGGRLVELEPTGPLVSGVLTDATWEVEDRAFEPGDALVVFSDGLLEARDAHGTEFGQARVESVLAATAGRAPAEVVTRLRSAVRDHAVSQRDDVTVLVVRRG
ncbi:PP2C family protein-serine/threonine phosphatase [Nocardioides hankookensis]|uniref:PP2C family protein-serine/threonine phosphatase n=1 Tax=Nocardioides hankookensis TaxID=443157 RepID=A0ABW1LPG3_9ACTN